MSSAISLMEIVNNRLDKDDVEIISRYKDFYAPIFGEESFSEYVYELVKKRNPSKFITKSSIHIVIQDKSMDDALFLYPGWKHINGLPEIILPPFVKTTFFESNFNSISLVTQHLLL